MDLPELGLLYELKRAELAREGAGRRKPARAPRPVLRGVRERVAAALLNLAGRLAPPARGTDATPAPHSERVSA